VKIDRLAEWSATDPAIVRRPGWRLRRVVLGSGGTVPPGQGQLLLLVEGRASLALGKASDTPAPKVSATTAARELAEGLLYGVPNPSPHRLEGEGHALILSTSVPAGDAPWAVGPPRRGRRRVFANEVLSCDLLRLSSGLLARRRQNLTLDHGGVIVALDACKAADQALARGDVLALDPGLSVRLRGPGAAVMLVESGRTARDSTPSRSEARGFSPFSRS